MTQHEQQAYEKAGRYEFLRDLLSDSLPQIEKLCNDLRGTIDFDLWWAIRRIQIAAENCKANKVSNIN